MHACTMRPGESAAAGADRALACALASSTSIFAAGCVTLILFRMVAPSLVMITSPLGCDTCAPAA